MTAGDSTGPGAPGRLPRVLLLCQSLTIAGGVERFACALANHLAGQGIDTVLGSADTPRTAVAYPLDARVRMIAGTATATASSHEGASGLTRVWRLLCNQWRTGRALARLIRIERPDVIVLNGLTTACPVLLMRPGCASRVICCDHNHFDARSRPWRLLRSWLYPKVAALVSLTEADAPKFRALNPRTEVIYNASSLWADASTTSATPSTSTTPSTPSTSTTPSTPSTPAKPVDPPTVLAIGRCVAQKGFDLLLQAWRIVADRLPGVRLRIVGDGPLHAGLVAQAAWAGLADRIDWLAPTPHIEHHYRDATLFVLPSRYEGMPLVLLEAQAMGVPAVAFDCPTGPREIVGETTGIVVPAQDVQALAGALIALLSDPARRERMARAALQRSREKFSPEQHFERWTALVRAVASRQKARHA